jgi:hypothetical protein
MRIALLFSGQPRFIKDSYPLFKKNLLDLNVEVDVFAFFWWDESNVGQYQTDYSIRKDDPRKWTKWNADSLETFTNRYAPVKMVTEKEFDYASVNQDIYNTPFARETVSMYNSYLRVSQIKQDYEKQQDFKYDWVIRSRTDFGLNKKLEFEKMDNSKLYIVDGGIPTMNNRAFDCNFAFGNSENMDTYCDLFLNLENYVLREGAGPLSGEPLLYHHLYKNGFESPRLPNTLLPSAQALDASKRNLPAKYRTNNLPIRIDQDYLKYNRAADSKMNRGDCWIIRKFDLK